jgi:hypothetical protein
MRIEMMDVNYSKKDYSALTVYNSNTQNEVLNIGKTPDDPIQIEPWRA